MLRGFLGRCMFYDVLDVVLAEARRVLGTRLSVVVFGSSVFSRDPRDLDLLVVVPRAEDPVGVSVRLSARLSTLLRVPVQVHVVELGDLTPSNPLVWGLAMGFEVLWDEVGAEEAIRRALARVKDAHVLVDGRGRVDLAVLAKYRGEDREDYSD